MRKRITKTLLTAVALCTALSAEAYDFEAGGICYNITSEADKTVEVTYRDYKGDFTIPSTVNNDGTTYTVTSIGYEAFYKCSDLTSINIPDGIISIGEAAFYNCSSLTSIDIPAGVASIGKKAFYGCTSLTEINSLATVPPACGTSCFYGIDKENCTLNIPAGTESAYKAAKGWKGFLYEGYFTVDEFRYAVISSENLTVAVVSTGEKYSGNITIPSSIEHNGNTYKVTSMEDRLFYECSGLTSISLPENITAIEEYTFYNCNNLTTITIPDGVTEIGDYAFCYCRNLTSVTLSNTLETIGENAFDSCSSLASIDIPDGVTEIKPYAFFGCSNLPSITIPDKVTSIGDFAFPYCSGLTSINIPNGVTKIGDYAFSSCRNLTSVTLGNGLETIGGHAFYECSGLTSIDIPDGVTEIGESAFLGCSNLTSITIPDGVTSIGKGVFSSCTSLTSIDIPDGVTEIGESAFTSCSSLTSINIPDGVTSIGRGAFFYCTGLTEINSLATVPPVCGMSCFYSIDKDNCTLYVPEGTIAAYKAADEWKDFANIVEIDFSGSEEIAADAAADVKVYAAAGRIVVENAAAGTPIAVYTDNGMLIYSGVVSDTFTEIPAPTGKLYIVKCGNAVFKTIM